MHYKDFIELEEAKDTYIEFVNDEICDEIISWRGKKVAKEFEGMIGNEEVGVYGKNNKEIVGHAWCILGKYNLKPNDMFIINDNQAMIHYLRVREEYRGKGICPHMQSSLIEYVHDNYGVNEFYIARDKGNIASHNCLSKIGFKDYGQYTIYKFLRIVLNK